MVDIPDNYYLINFLELIRFVGRTYHFLLSNEEREFCSRFESLPENSQRLYIRLLCRTKSLFRAGKLNYPEISATEQAAVTLQENGFLDINSVSETELLLPMFNRVEITQKLSLQHLKALKRADLDKHVLTELDLEYVLARLLERESIYEVLQQEHFVVFRLCFFGNLYQDMTDFVLRDLGLTQYEPYIIDENNRAFRNREQINAHLDYYRYAELLEDVTTDSDKTLLELHAELPQPARWDTNLQRRCQRLTNTIARQLERQKNYPEAIRLYQMSQRPPSRERQSRIFAETGRIQEALDLCRLIGEEPMNEEEAVFAAQFGARIAKKASIEWPAAKRYLPPVETLQLNPSDQSVEQITAEHYSHAGLCFYTENTLFNGVFGLAIWDILFASLPGVFFNPFQSAPADFYEPQFRSTRHDQLATRFAELTTVDALSQRVWSVYNLKYGIQNPMVNWRYLSTELLDLALERIPIDHWLSIFHRLLADLRHHRTGFTDLILFPDAGDYVLIEVKGPGDTLQKNQIRWMQFYAEHGIAHKVTHVSWLEPVDNSA